MVQELVCVRNLGEHFLNESAHEMVLSLYLKVNPVKGDVSFTLIFATTAGDGQPRNTIPISPF